MLLIASFFTRIAQVKDIMSDLSHKQLAKSLPHRPTFSIITVCRNSRQVIGGAISSLSNQSVSDFEYVVIDGASTDGTLDLIREMTAGVNVQIVSEPDAGIYDAMNKGVRMARGKWLYFLNAGDRFADHRVLERVMSAFEKSPKCSLAYGDVIYFWPGKQRLVRFNWLTRWNLRFENLCHQAVFARRELFERLGEFDMRYPINADFDWLLRVFTSGAKYKYLGFPIAFYEATGFSERNLEKRVIERKIVRNKYLPKLGVSLLELSYRVYLKARRVLGISIR
jgi:glycosyltransferase involved in cell wall biosynthesis